MSWEEIVAEIRANICVVEYQHESRVYPVDYVGKRRECGHPAPESAVGLAVDAAYADAAPVLVSVMPARKSEVASMTDSYARRTELMQELYLQEPAFLRILVPRVDAELRARGLQCTDCPALREPQRRQVSWDEFAEYLVLQIWPHRTTVAEREAYGIDDEFMVHVCVGINGFASMDDPDPELVRAAFVTVAQSMEALQPRIRPWLEQAIEQTEGVPAAQREAAVQAKMGEIVTGSPVLRQQVCAQLRSFREDLLVDVADCDA